MKIAIVYAFKDSSWFSCTKITSNLVTSYKEVYSGEELEFFDYDYRKKNFDLKELEEKLFNYRPDKIIFLDHNPHPLQLMIALSKRKFTDENRPEVVIHIFGCFTLNFQKWKLLAVALKQYKVKFFCASDRQVNLVSQFFEDTNSFIKKIPFPVNSSDFNYQQSSGEIKQELGLDSSSKLILYTGRLSLQKRIIELMDIFVKAHQNEDVQADTYLLLAGKFDSFAFHFGNIFQNEGEYFRMLDRAMSKYPQQILDKIIFLGNVKNSQLQKYYCEADLFVSFSTYHDEDYGMSVAEAGICGTPLLLTDWAGFSSFKKNDSCQLVETYLTKKSPEFVKKEAYDKLISMLNSEPRVTREQSSQDFINEHSISSISVLLKEYLSQEINVFEGFNSFLNELAHLEKNYKHPFFNQIDRALSSNYLKVYASYVREN